jgi:hypothetical protein
MGYMLGQHDESRRKEQVIYYLSKKINDCKSRYTTIEKLCRALVWSADSGSIYCTTQPS